METTINSLSEVLGCKPGHVLTRLKAIGKADCCTRCGGGGHYSYNQLTGTRCFKCSGSGVQMPKLTAAFQQEVEASVAAGDLKPYLEQLAATKAAQKAGADLAQDYAALVEVEKNAGLIPKVSRWSLSSQRGRVIRAAAHPAFIAAQSLFMTAKYEKTTEARDAKYRKAMELRAEMFAAVEQLVPSGLSEAIEDTLTQDDSAYEITRSVGQQANARVRAILS